MSSRAASRFNLNIRAKTLRPDARSIFYVLAVAAVMIVPAMVYGIPSNLDLTNHFRFALPFYDAIQSGDLYPGWLAESNSGYGDPSFRFYPPGFYYLFAFTRFINGDWYSAALLTFLILSAASGLGMYLWAKCVLSSRTAMLAGIFYALAPYRVNQLYQASLLAEYAASAILPFVLLFVERVCRSGSRRDIAGLATAYALLLLTHLPLAVIGSMAFVIYAALLIGHREKTKTLAKLSAALCLALIASAFYWITMIFELKWIGVNRIHPDGSVEYHRNFLLSTLSPENLNVWWMNILAAGTVLFFLPAIALVVKRNTGLTISLKPVAVLLLTSTLMTLPLSWPIWRLLPPLQHTQFPWRWLVVVSLAGSVLAAAAVPLWFGKGGASKTPVRLLVFGAVIISIAFTVSHSIREAQYLNRGEFEALLKSLRGSASVNYWFPVWASPTAKKMPTEIEIADRTAIIERWAPERRRFSVSSGEATEARIRTFYYPHWIATSQGRPLNTWPAPDGALMISLPTETATVDLEFLEPKRTRNSAVLSAFGWLLIGGLVSPLRRRMN